jgi:hypothetical protein
VGIKIVNRGLEYRSEPQHELRKTITHVELRFKFEAIPLSEQQTPTDAGMALIDLAAYGLHPYPTGTAPPKSVALNVQTSIPVLYAPIEGRAVGGTLGDTLEEGLFTILGSVFFAGATWPVDARPSNSDFFVPSLSARNLNPSNSQRLVPNTYHFHLTDSSDVAGRFEQLLGSDESLYIRP